MEIVKKHNRAAVAAAKDYASQKPWQGEFDDRVSKLYEFHADLCAAYDIEVELIVSVDAELRTKASGFVTYNADGDTVIIMHPGLAVMTYLRLFAEALESDRAYENVSGDEGISAYCARWANGLFMKAFPKSWDRLVEANAPILSRDYC